jgi:hypothetical protein
MFLAALEPKILAWQSTPAAFATGPQLIAVPIIQSIRISFDYYRMKDRFLSEDDLSRRVIPRKYPACKSVRMHAG